MIIVGIVYIFVIVNTLSADEGAAYDFGNNVQDEASFDYYGSSLTTTEPENYLRIGDVCDPINDDCGANMECRKTTYCPGELPTCQCLPGFSEDRANNICRLLVQLGERCRGQNYTCAPANSFCNEQDNACQCRPDYKPGPNGNDCVWTWKTLFYGETCRRSVQCHYNMSCDNFKCSCPIASRVDPKNNAQCLINGLDNTCSRDDDCFRRNSSCIAGRCHCQPEYDAMTLRFNDLSTPSQEVCVHTRTRRRSVGEVCSVSYPFTDGVCVEGLVCSTQCAKPKPICVDPKDNSGPPTTTQPPPKVKIAMYGDRCTGNLDCLNFENSLICKRPWAATCRGRLSSASENPGVCTCADGFYLHGEGQCLPKPEPARLGETCVNYIAADVVGNCQAANSVCVDARCMCKLGYKPGPRGDDCVTNWKTQYLGEECHDSVQCHYNMVCSSGTCSCQSVGLPGDPLSMPDGRPGTAIVDCKKVNVGDRCENDGDCSGLNNVACSVSSKRCECHDGYVMTPLRLGAPDDVTVWCLPEEITIFQFRREGESCNFVQPIDRARTSLERVSPVQQTLPCDPNELYCAKCTDSPTPSANATVRSVCVKIDFEALATTTTTTTTSPNAVMQDATSSTSLTYQSPRVRSSSATSSGGVSRPQEQALTRTTTLEAITDEANSTTTVKTSTAAAATRLAAGFDNKYPFIAQSTLKASTPRRASTRPRPLNELDGVQAAQRLTHQLMQLSASANQRCMTTAALTVSFLTAIFSIKL